MKHFSSQQQPTTLPVITSASSMPAVPDGCEEKTKRSVEEGKEEKKSTSGGESEKSNIGEQSGDVIVEEVDGGTTSTDLSGWQVRVDSEWKSQY